jgi:predicted DNA-binding transcriptional regulator YafY
LRLVRRVHFAGFIDAQLDVVAAPYGLVAKTSVWHVVCACDGQLQVFRASHILEAEMLDEGFTRPTDFDLGAFWSNWCAGYERNRPRYTVTACVAPGSVALVSKYRAEGTTIAGVRDAAGWATLTLTFESLFDARAKLLALGGDVEVMEPEPLRLSMADYAQQIRAVYARK